MELEDSDNSDSTPPLSGELPSLSLFIENMGLHYQEYGVPRIGGRILGLLFIHPQPISAEEMAEALQVSRSSISTNLRTLLLTDLVEKVSRPGERVDFYVVAPNLWQKALEMRLAAILPLRSIAMQALEGLGEQHPARQRLQEMIAWVEQVEEMMQHLDEKWQPRQEVPVG